MKTAFCVVALSSLLVLPASAISFTYDANTQGWLGRNLLEVPPDTGAGTGPVAVNYLNSGGNPGGQISIIDPDGGNFYFEAPASILGNQSAIYGGSLSYQIFLTFNDYHSQPDVILMGNGQTLVASLGVDGFATGGWRDAAVGLTEGAWHKSSLVGAIPTALEFQAVLADLTAVLIRGEYGAGQIGIEVARLDNVSFSAEAIPETGAPVLAILGSLAAYGLYRRRQA